MLYDYLPGQEEANLDFVRQRAMGDYEEVPASRRVIYNVCVCVFVCVCVCVCVCVYAPGCDERLWRNAYLSQSYFCCVSYIFVRQGVMGDFGLVPLSRRVFYFYVSKIFCSAPVRDRLATMKRNIRRNSKKRFFII